jgi:TatD DNase family protein
VTGSRSTRRQRAESPARHELPPSPAPLPAAVFDAHCHLDAMAERAGVQATPAYVAAALDRAAAVGVAAVITVGDTLASAAWCVAAADEHPDVYAAVAVHPTEVTGLTDDGYDELARLAANPRVVAIGETGLDYYWDRTPPSLQEEHFRRHIDLAKRAGLPLMIHDRDAHADVLRVLREEGAPERVVFHAFSGDEVMARTCVEQGWVLSFPGVVTFTNAPGLRAAVATTPLTHILLETDAPFLTPHPFRGRPNAPYLLPYTVRAVAEATASGIDELGAAVRVTAHRIFGINLAQRRG